MTTTPAPYGEPTRSSPDAATWRAEDADTEPSDKAICACPYPGQTHSPSVHTLARHSDAVPFDPIAVVKYGTEVTEPSDEATTAIYNRIHQEMDYATFVAWLVADRQRVAREAVSEALAEVEALHRAEKRWQDHPDADCSYDTEDEAREYILDCGGDETDEPTFFEVCAHCRRLEDWQSEESGEDHIGYRDSLWPCATAKIIAAARKRAGQ